MPISKPISERPLYNSKAAEYELDPTKAFEVAAKLADYVRAAWIEANKSRWYTKADCTSQGK